ncbi:disease resistance protein RPP13-like [Macadamia integrifolia]|uniref:disease resistance protein RPP13-like n=1 Tax=Macadamia integrifolia TaxID=60698 RepID=UPI001C4EA1CD|nr:disease resistance protein RPP13-like [Macadamia integrifolia]
MIEHSIAFVIGKLGSLLSEEADFLSGMKTQIVSLHEELEWINLFLRDTDEKPTTAKKYRAEDYSTLFGNQLEDIKRRIGEISANKSKYGIESFETGETSARLDNGLARKRRRDTVEEEVDVVGFEEDIEELATLLIEEESQQPLLVSIVGTGGLGKTTLAKKVYDEIDVKKTFDSCAWIYVSQEHQLKDLLSKAIAQLMMLKKEELEKKNEEDLKNLLSGYLKEQRCLLVFDDVWRKEYWDTLKLAFLPHRDEGKQQRVLLTIRIVEVAKHADPLTAPHLLAPSSGEESFELFSKKALTKMHDPDAIL